MKIVSFFRTLALRQSLFSIHYSQIACTKQVSIVNSLFSFIPHEDSLHSQFAILRPPTWSKYPFPIRHSQTVHMNTVFILNSTFLACLHAKSLYSQFAIIRPPQKDSLHSRFSILRLTTRRQSLFSIRHSQTANMNIVSILNSPFLDCPCEDSLHSQFAIIRLPMWR